MPINGRVDRRSLPPLAAYPAARPREVDIADYYDAHVGLDVHKDAVLSALADESRNGEVRLIGVVQNQPEAIARLARKLAVDHRHDGEVCQCLSISQGDN